MRKNRQARLHETDTGAAINVNRRRLLLAGAAADTSARAVGAQSTPSRMP